VANTDNSLIKEKIEMKKSRELLEGFIDMHIHAGPSLMAREIDAWDMALSASAAGYRAVVIKDHHIPSVAAARIINSHLPHPETRVFGSIAMNSSVGGLNPKALEAAIGFGAAVVWMPTVSSRNHAVKHSGHGLKFPGTTHAATVPEPEYVITDDAGRLIPDAYTILEIMARHENVALATGHGSRDEVDAVIRAAAEMGISRIVATHPHYMVDATDDDLLAWSSLNAFIELNAVISVPDSKFFCIPLQRVIDIIHNVGPEHIIISSDYGQKGNGNPVEGMETFIAILLENGIGEDAIRMMGHDNPSYLLGI